MRSARPHGKGVLKPRHNMIIGGERTPGGLMGRSPGGSEASFAGVQSLPLRGGTVQARMALRGQIRGRRERRFFGGARSLRPDGMGLRVPRDIVIPEGLPEILRVAGSSLGFFCGRAEPGLALPWNPN